MQELGDVGRDTRQHDLGLGVAEADVVLDDLGAVGGEHHPRVEHAAVVGVVVGEPPQRGSHRAVHHLVDDRVGDDRAPVSTRPCRRCWDRGRRRATRLKSCAGARGSAASGSPLHTTSSDSSGPVRPSSIDERAPGVAERLARQVGAHRVARLGERLGDDDALARGETVGLDHVGRRELLEERERGGFVVDTEAAVAGGGHARLGEHLLHPRLRPLEPCAGRAGTEAVAPAGAHRVGDARDQRHLGADDDEVGVEVVGELRDLRGIGGVDREAERGLRRCPDCPGAANTSGADGDRCSAHTSACSRPPDPTTRTRTVRQLGAARRSVRGRGRHRRS